MVEPTLPDRTDVVVVGGGVMGTAIACFLTRDSDRDVTLLERDHVAAGSTGDSSAILRHHYGDEAIYTETAWWSHRFFRNFEEEMGAKLAYDPSPLVRFANEGTPGGEYALVGYEVLAERDIPVTEYVGDELHERYPMYETADAFDFAISDDEAAYSDGTDAAMGFARGASEHGARIETGVTVESIDVEDDSVVALETSAGRLPCEAVVVAAGPWTPKLAESVGVEIPITTTREQVVILEPSDAYLEKYPSRTPTTGLPGGEWYVRPDGQDGVLVATHRYTEEIDPDRYDDRPDEETILELADALAENVPGLRDAGLMGQYCGVYSVTPDHDFVIDEAGPDGCYLTCGFSGHGFKHAPAVGKMTTDLIMTGESDLVDLEYFSLDRFENDPSGHGRPADNI